MQYATRLPAGQWITQETAGNLFVIMGLAGVATIELRLFNGREELESIKTAARGLQAKVPKGFSRVELRADADATIDYLISDGDVAFDWFQGSQVNVTVQDGPVPVTNDAGQPLKISNSDGVPLTVQAPEGEALAVEFDREAPLAVEFDRTAPLSVEMARGEPALPLYVAAMTVADAPATAVQNLAAVPVTDAATALVAADATRRELRLCNRGTAAVAIGAPGLTWAARCIVIEPGDLWIESRAAALAWAAICDAGQASEIGIQGVTA